VRAKGERWDFETSGEIRAKDIVKDALRVVSPESELS